MDTENTKTILNQLVERFKSGNIAELVKVATIKLTGENSLPSQKWSFLNQFIALMESGEIDCRGFNQWKDVQRHVKKGGKAVHILAPIKIKKVNDEGQEYYILVGFKAIPVFPASMTEGKELPDIQAELTPESLPPLAEVAKKWGIEVNYTPYRDKAYGSFSPGAQQILLATYEENIFFHELAHAAHSRIEKLRGGQNARQETIAQFVSCVLMMVYGLRDDTGFTWEYIKGYNPDDPVKAIASALDTIEQVIDLILSEAEALRQN